MKHEEYKTWSKKHQRYIESQQWRELRETMPGPRECAVCSSNQSLHLHHMYYPKDLFKTEHCHCCWLCQSCHEAFHRRVKGTLDTEETWDKLRNRTKKIVLREIKNPTSKKRTIRTSSNPTVASILLQAKNLAPIPYRAKPTSTAPSYLAEIKARISKEKKDSKFIKSRLKSQKKAIDWFASLPSE